MKLLFAVAPLFAIACMRPPAGVPADATRVYFGAHGGWARCWLDTDHHVNRCRIYNAKGIRLVPAGHREDEDDVFVKSSGSGVVPAEDLQIDSFLSQPTIVWLKNGVIMVPLSDFEIQSKFAEALKAVATAREWTKPVAKLEQAIST